jgi:hypothetical protein
MTREGYPDRSPGQRYWKAACVCGWRGPEQPVYGAAESDMTAHADENLPR